MPTLIPRPLQALALAGALAALPLAVSAEGPVIVMPETVEWTAVGDAGMEISVLYGDPRSGGEYAMLIKVPQGMRIPPHIHADPWRFSVILSGTLLFGFGEVFDEDAMQSFTPGTFWTETPDAYHYAWARDGEVIAMLTASGPTGTSFAPAPE